MIEKELTPPIPLLQDEAAIRRLRPDHPVMPQLLSDLKIWKSGYQGEKATRYYFDMLPPNEFHIFYGLHLPRNQGKYYFQIDLLLLNHHFALILETKNHKGIQKFNPQFIDHTREYNNQIDVFKDPMTQAEYQTFHLQKWYERHGVIVPPIDYYVLFSHPTAQLIAPQSYTKAMQKIAYLDQLPKKIIATQNKYKKDIFTSKDLKKISRLLLKEHQITIPAIGSRFELDAHDFIKGVICPQCKCAPMIRIHGKWECANCHCISGDAHEQAILDRFLLIGETMTNAECRDWLGVKSEDIVYRILKSMNLPASGTRYHRVYHPPFR